MEKTDEKQNIAGTTVGKIRLNVKRNGCQNYLNTVKSLKAQTRRINRITCMNSEFVSKFYGEIWPFNSGLHANVDCIETK